ncbi:hypothetical protein ACQEUU_02615 [Nonomuraea sp. CA-218870]|uniref:hypothetical protein n=1 Tax=Nonomuraea sp. CA-218870 TaxID=3239998 RepID=UPI003D8BCB0D
MTDPYTITTDRPSDSEKSSTPRMALWTVLIVCLAANLVANTIGGWGVLVGVITGLVALACGAGLVVDHRNRRRL